MDAKIATTAAAPAARRRAATAADSAACPEAAWLETHAGEDCSLYQAAVEALSAQIAVIDRRGCIVALNRAWRESAGPLSGVDGLAAVSLEDLPIGLSRDEAAAGKILAGVREVLAGRRPLFAIDFPVGHNMATRWHRLAASPLDGRTGGAVVVLQDISALKAVEAERDQLASERACEERRILEASRQADSEIDALQNLPQGARSCGAAEVQGIDPLSRRLPREFAELVEQYTAALKRLVLNRAYRLAEQAVEPFPLIAERIGVLKGGPRDVIELHRLALDRLALGAREVRARVLVEEGRMLLITLLGYLSAFYRSRALGGTAEEERGSP